MKLKKYTVSLVALAALVVVGCAAGAGAAKSVSDESLSLRKTTVFNENVAPTAATYSKAAPGTAKTIERSYQDAPPLIPHSVEGLLPITRKNNACLGCHMPDVAKSMGATPIPVSHFTNFRPSSSYALKGENTSDGTLKHVSIKKQKELYQGRYNCTQCHAPQANVAPLVGNNFQPVYSKPDGEFKSSWNDNEFMKDIDTTK